MAAVESSVIGDEIWVLFIRRGPAGMLYEPRFAGRVARVNDAGDYLVGSSWFARTSDLVFKSKAAADAYCARKPGPEQPEIRA